MSHAIIMFYLYVSLNLKRTFCSRTNAKHFSWIKLLLLFFCCFFAIFAILHIQTILSVCILVCTLFECTWMWAREQTQCTSVEWSLKRGKNKQRKTQKWKENAVKNWSTRCSDENGDKWYKSTSDNRVNAGEFRNTNTRVPLGFVLWQTIVYSSTHLWTWQIRVLSDSSFHF